MQDNFGLIFHSLFVQMALQAEKKHFRNDCACHTADADTDENYVGSNSSLQRQTHLFCSFGGGGAQQFKWGKLLYLHWELFLLTVELVCLQSVELLLDILSHCKQGSSNCK